MMPEPDNFSPRAYDAAQGRDDMPDDVGEYEAVRKALERLVSAAEVLGVIETSDAVFNLACWTAAEDIDAALAGIRRVLP